MEQKIREYETYIKSAAKRPSKGLAEYHQEMVQNFQHERLVHLLIMLFFVFLTIVSIAAAFLLTPITASVLVLAPIYILTAILFVLTLFYIKHYYFLENHIQGLYKYNRILRK